MSPAETEALIKALAPVCKAQGIRRIRVGELELEFGGSAPDAAAVAAFAKMFETGQPTEEDMLNWSSPGYVPSTERPPSAAKE